MVANVETMMSVRETPWHKIGTIVQEAPTSKEAIELAGLDWDVIPSPVMVMDKVAKGYIANVRSDNHETLGIVSDRYTIVQNSEAFAFTDKLIEDGEARYETAGSLGNGKRVWMLARLNKEMNILGDNVTPYLCLTNTHDGSGAVRVMVTPVRVVCQNTLNLAIRGAARSWSANHVGNLEAKFHEAERTLDLSNKYLIKLEEEAELLQQKIVTFDDFKLSIVPELIPVPKKASDRQLKTIAEEQNALIECYNMEDIKKFEGTGWAAINAVTDYLAHRKPKRQTDTFDQRLFRKVVNGHKLLDKAYDLLTA